MFLVISSVWLRPRAALDTGDLETEQKAKRRRRFRPIVWSFCSACVNVFRYQLRLVAAPGRIGYWRSRDRAEGKAASPL